MTKFRSQGFSGVKPEMFITEWNLRFYNISIVADCMNYPYRAANIACRNAGDP